MRCGVGRERGAFEAAETVPVARSTGLHVFDQRHVRFDYAAFGITDATRDLTGGIALCFPSNPIYPISDAEKRRDSAAAMTSYEPLWKNLMAAAGVAIDTALLRQ